MGSPRARRVLAGALVAVSGCSLVAVRRPPSSPPPPGAPVECTQSRVAPVLDIAGAISTPIVGLTAWGLCTSISAMMSWGQDPKPLRCGPLLLGTAAGTAAYAGSAAYGYRATADCRRLLEQGGASAPGPPLQASPTAGRDDPRGSP